WDDTVDRVRNRLSKWKMKMLSSGGRLTLMKSVLGAMLIFHMSLLKVPEGSSLWARVIKAIYGMDGSIGDIRSGNSKSCWSSIINEVNVLSSKGIMLMNYLRITLGNGVFTCLWDEPWHVEGILKDRLPRGGIENAQFVEFSILLQQVVLAQGSDRWTWTTNGSGQFFVALVMTGSLATRFDISRRGIVIDSILCGNCNIGVETTSHLFFTCDMATSVRRLINMWWEVSDMEIDSYATWKGWFVTIRMASKNKLMFEALLDDEQNDVRNGNLVCLPLSLDIVLGMLTVGAEGDILKQLLGFLRQGIINQFLFESRSAKLLAQSISNQNSGLESTLANGVWVEKYVKLESHSKGFLKLFTKQKPPVWTLKDE
nr:RNA-directed DNA polymerase, eukaryota, reverse transcriptase zinc-binding domain protein [Tanacetum cinerariifolium]